MAFLKAFSITFYKLFDHCIHCNFSWNLFLHGGTDNNNYKKKAQQFTKNSIEYGVLKRLWDILLRFVSYLP